MPTFIMNRITNLLDSMVNCADNEQDCKAVCAILSALHPAITFWLNYAVFKV